jgi:BA14K-like protein
MIKLKLIGTALIASVIATAIVVDTADARRGGGGGGGARAGGGFGGGGMRAGGFNRGGALAGNRIGNAGSFNRVSNPIRTADFGRPGRPDFGQPGRPGNRPGWGGGWDGNNWGSGWGWGAAAVGAGLAYGAASNYYCDPNYDASCNAGYGSYGSYAPAYGTSYGYESAYGSSDAIAECARRFRSYDPASQTYLSYNGQRIQCPQ